MWVHTFYSVLFPPPTRTKYWHLLKVLPVLSMPKQYVYLYIRERKLCNEKKNGLALIFLSRCLNSSLLAALKSSHGNKL